MSKKPRGQSLKVFFESEISQVREFFVNIYLKYPGMCFLNFENNF